MASGIVFYHRFYMFHSFKEFSRWVTATTCLFLAGKVEETPKKCRDIIKMTHQSLPEYRFKAFVDNPTEEIMVIERILLQTIKFDLHLNHPYTYLIKFGKLLKGDMEKINGFVQKAWIFINDSLSTTLCLRYKPQVIGLAVLLLSFKLSNQNIRDFMGKPRTDWWKIFYPEAKEPDLEDICEELTNMYSGKPPKRRFANVNIADKVKNSPKNAPGSPQTKKSKLTSESSQSTTTTTSATTSSVTSTTATTTTSAATVTTSSNTPSTTSTVTTTTASTTAAPLPPLNITNEVSNKPKTLPNDNAAVKPPLPTGGAEPMQLATPTTNVKVSFSSSNNISVTSTPSKAPPLDPPYPPHSAHGEAPPHLPHSQQPMMKPNSFSNEHQHHHHQQQPPPLKTHRHEQLKSYLHQNSPNSSQSAFTQQQQNSPYKATAPILDHMSSFFQSTPPSKSQQPPPLNKPPRSFGQQQNQQNSPAHVMQPSTPPISMMEQLTKQRLPLTPNLKPAPPLPQMPPQQQQQQQQRFNNNFNQFNNQPPQLQQNLSNFQPQLAPPPQIPPAFGVQNNNFMPMPPQGPQQQQPFMNNQGNNAPMNNFNNFNPPQQQQQQPPMMMQNQNPRPPLQNQMNPQHPPYPGNFY